MVLSQLKAQLPHLLPTPNHRACSPFRSTPHCPSRYFTPFICLFVDITPPLCSDLMSNWLRLLCLISSLEMHYPQHCVLVFFLVALLPLHLTTPATSLHMLHDKKKWQKSSTCHAEFVTTLGCDKVREMGTQWIVRHSATGHAKTWGYIFCLWGEADERCGC